MELSKAQHYVFAGPHLHHIRRVVLSRRCFPEGAELPDAAELFVAKQE